MPFLETLKKYFYVLIIIVVITTVLAFVISVVQPPKYSSTVKLLIIQKQTAGTDAYAATRSAETIGNILSKMVYTSSFFEDVMKSDFDVKDIFPEDPEKRKKQWKEDVETKIIGDIGALEITAYHQDSYKAEQLTYAIAYVLTSKGREYHGGGPYIFIKMVDLPFTSERPVKPNVLENSIIGFMLGALAGLGIIYLLQRPEVKVKEITKVLEKPEVKKRIVPKAPEKEFVPKPPEVKERPPKVERRISREAKPTPPPREISKREEPYAPERVDRWIKTGKFE